MKLVAPTLDMEKHLIDMANDYKIANEDRYQIALEENFKYNEYIQKLNKGSIGEDLEPGYVPTTTFWLIDENGKILGVSRLRHYLLPHLEEEGGNIGYDVPPSERRKGHATILLKHTLDKAREMGIEEILITCDTDNIGSAKVIINNGGIFKDEVTPRESEKRVSRYWIK